MKPIRIPALMAAGASSLNGSIGRIGRTGNQYAIYKSSTGNIWQPTIRVASYVIIETKIEKSFFVRSMKCDSNEPSVKGNCIGSGASPRQDLGTRPAIFFPYVC